MTRIYFLMLLVTTMSAQSWELVCPEPFQHLHASGETAVAWSDSSVSLSVDGGRTWTAPINPVARSATAQPTIRIARAARDGSVYLVSGSGDLLVGGTRQAWTRIAPSVAVVTTDGSGNAWTVSASDSSLQVIAPGTSAPRIVGRGMPILTLDDGVVVRNGSALQLVTPTGTSALRWRGDQENIPQPFTIAPATSPLCGVGSSTGGRMYLIEHGELADYANVTMTVLSIAAERGQTYLFGVTNQQTGLWVKEHTGWQMPQDIHREGVPRGTTAMSLTKSAFLALSPDGLLRLRRD